MRNNKPIMLGVDHYIQGPNSLQLVGPEAKFIGTKAIIIAGKTAWEKTGATISKSLKNSGISFDFISFSTYCTEELTSKIAEMAKNANADLIIGVGGGRCLDTAKYSAHKAKIRVLQYLHQLLLAPHMLCFV